MSVEPRPPIYPAEWLTEENTTMSKKFYIDDEPDFYKENWVCFSPAMDSPETDEIVAYLMSEGIKQQWYTTYGSLRSALWGMGLEVEHPHIFHSTTYVGSTLEEVKAYLNEIHS